jgi:hypothetical protein
MLDLVIRNGEVVTPQGVGRWTVGIRGEQIAYVGIDDPSMQAGPAASSHMLISTFSISPTPTAADPR